MEKSGEKGQYLALDPIVGSRVKIDERNRFSLTFILILILTLTLTPLTLALTLTLNPDPDT